MTDYNDGKWHGWNGGDCPVHELSIVETVFSNGTMPHPVAGAAFPAEAWGDGGIIAFRVVKAYVEPREFFVVGSIAFNSKGDAKVYMDNTGLKGIHVREVLE